VLRVTGAPEPTETNATPQLRYAMIFKLNRRARLNVASYDVPEGMNTGAGNYSIGTLGSGWSTENSVFGFGPSRNHCLVGYFNTDFPDTVSELDAVPVGQRVRVALRPLTPTTHGKRKLVLGRLYVRRPKMESIDYALSAPGSRDRLRRIGCPTTTDIQAAAAVHE
jgi:hypothetical protein